MVPVDASAILLLPLDVALMPAELVFVPVTVILAALFRVWLPAPCMEMPVPMPAPVRALISPASVVTLLAVEPKT
ncbi:MAG: hypothetical protein MESAZ_00428 [Saezia sanguinis]